MSLAARKSRRRGGCANVESGFCFPHLHSPCEIPPESDIRGRYEGAPGYYSSKWLYFSVLCYCWRSVNALAVSPPDAQTKSNLTIGHREYSLAVNTAGIGAILNLLANFVSQRIYGQPTSDCKGGRSDFGAEEGTRTPTPLRVHGPEPCASANSATSARRLSPARTAGLAAIASVTKGTIDVN